MPENGFSSAFLKLGGAVFVDIERFYEIWHEQNGHVYVPTANQRPSSEGDVAHLPTSGARNCCRCGIGAPSCNSTEEC